MAWSQAIIPIGKEKVTLLPEAKSKYTVFPSDDPKSQILYQENYFSNYMIMPRIEEMGIQPEVVDCIGCLNLMEVLLK